MHFFGMPFSRIALSLVCLLPLAAQTSEDGWKTATELPGVDLKSLTPPQAKAALTALRKEGCSCGCSMKLAECRIKDPQCGVSHGLASQSVQQAKAGKTAEQIQASLAETIRARMLGAPVAIPVFGAPVKGPADAKVTIVEFSDFQCPYCAQAVERANAVLAMYPKDVKLIFKQFPLDIHSQARIAAEAALAANAQGKFWALHDKMYQHYRELSKNNILAYAKEAGLDMERFTADLNSGKYRQQVDHDMADGETVGVQGTPTFFVNGKQFQGAFEPQQAKIVIDAELKR